MSISYVARWPAALAIRACSSKLNARDAEALARTESLKNPRRLRFGDMDGLLHKGS
jgi:hypothetical protein